MLGIFPAPLDDSRESVEWHRLLIEECQCLSEGGEDVSLVFRVKMFVVLLAFETFLPRENDLTLMSPDFNEAVELSARKDCACSIAGFDDPSNLFFRLKWRHFSLPNVAAQRSRACGVKVSPACKVPPTRARTDCRRLDVRRRLRLGRSRDTLKAHSGEMAFACGDSLRRSSAARDRCAATMSWGGERVG